MHLLFLAEVRNPRSCLIGSPCLSRLLLVHHIDRFIEADNLGTRRLTLLHLCILASHYCDLLLSLLLLYHSVLSFEHGLVERSNSAYVFSFERWHIPFEYTDSQFVDTVKESVARLLVILWQKHLLIRRVEIACTELANNSLVKSRTMHNQVLIDHFS